MIDSPKEWWTQLEAKESTSLENSIPIPTPNLELLEKLEAENEKLEAENEKLEAENEKLEAENERLKAENETDYSEAYNNCFENHVIPLKKENEKLRCLALHAMREYFKAMSTLNTWNEECYGETKYLHRVIRYEKLTKQYDYAYRKAMLTGYEVENES